jgi:hypothetical protein
MERVTDSNLGEKWDRLLLLLVAQPRDGWEAQFEELICRELERLTYVSRQVMLLCLSRRQNRGLV